MQFWLPLPHDPFVSHYTCTHIQHNNTKHTHTHTHTHTEVLALARYPARRLSKLSTFDPYFGDLFQQNASRRTSFDIRSHAEHFTARKSSFFLQSGRKHQPDCCHSALCFYDRRSTWRTYITIVCYLQTEICIPDRERSKTNCVISTATATADSAAAFSGK